MKQPTLLRVWVRLILKNKRFLSLIILLALFAASATLAKPDISILSDDKGAPRPDPNPF